MKAQMHDPESLRQLANDLGLETSYIDGTGKSRATSPEALAAILQALGHDIDRPIEELRAQHRDARWTRGLDPVIVAWHGQPFAAEAYLPEPLDRAKAQCELRLEDGERREWQVDLGAQLELRRHETGGTTYRSRSVPIPDPLPMGYHELRLTVGGRRLEALLVCAPRVAYQPPVAQARTWGAFVPLYALHGEKSWGVGDYGLLQEAAAWIAEAGGTTVGTLPLLPLFLDKPFDPSPYAPVSRLAWNELYVDPSLSPEFAHHRVQSFLRSDDTRRLVESLRASARVDYSGVHALKTQILHRMRIALDDNPDRRRALEQFLAAHPETLEYARFRAAHDRFGPWRSWAHPTRTPGEAAPDAVADHAYAQWLAQEQLSAAASAARSRGLGLYLDFPLGVHPEGFDAWNEQAVLVPGLSVGAPPDRYFTSGQDWGFSPLHPQRLREARYDYFRRCIRHHFANAGVLRIDHVMGLHRLFVIPKGHPASEGAYLQMPAEELYAILCLESHRHKTVLVGEDLGTVPDYVRPAMSGHGIHRMFVLQASLAPDKGQPLPAPPAESLASLNTHDLATFQGFWNAQDIPHRVSLGLLQPGKGLEAAQTRRETVRDAIIHTLQKEGWLPAGGEPTVRDILHACLRRLAASPAALVMVSLEDLWLEPEPQNVPGTGPQHPNWRRKIPFTVAELRAQPGINAFLADLTRLRKGAGQG